MQNTFTSTRKTGWKPNACFLRRHIPAALSGWLLDTASLTLRLQQLCPGKFSVRVLSQERGWPDQDEARVLGMKPGSLAIIRQVQLMCGKDPWIYARTVIPLSSLRGGLQRLTGIGTRPLGEILFADPGMRRGGVELARLRQGQAMYAAATRHLHRLPAEIWGRRSVFRLSGQPLLVSEIFLPAFPAGRPDQPCWRVR